MDHAYDTIIIGAGQAGGPLAHNLADRGWKVALVEREHLGGSCINYGCTPTKKMIASAKAAEWARQAARYGVHAGPVTVDLPEVVAMKDRLVEDMRQRQLDHVTSRPNISLYRGEARFTAPHTVQVNDLSLTAPLIFINTGSRAAIPSIEGIQQVPYLTNKTILHLTELPEHLLIVGGSYIGLEFGQMFRRFGSRVTVIETNDQIVPKEDADIAASLREALEAEGMRFLTNVQAERVSPGPGGGLRLELASAGGNGRVELEGSHLLIGAGRRPNTDALDLDLAGVKTRRGWIEVDDFLQTNVPGIYALGDVKGGPAFTHISYNDFQIVFHNLFHDEKQSIQDRIVPYALYTDPELGRVGLTEAEALRQGKRIKVGRMPMAHVARAIEMNRTQGLMKIVVDADTDAILGAAILSENGGELVQTLMSLMLAGAPWTVLHQAVYIHPTLTEGFFGLMDSVAAAPVQQGQGAQPQADQKARLEAAGMQPAS